MDWKEEREKLQREFTQRTMDAMDRVLLKEKLEKGTASYADALKYAQLTGQEAGGLLAEEIVTLYPDRILSAEDARQLIAPVMRENHELVTGATNAVQKQMNERAGLGLNAVVPEYNSSYENGVIYEAAAPDKTESYFEKAFLQKIENMSMATVDDALRANADFQAKCGIRKYIKRVPNGSCCAWCSALAGTYDYEDVSGAGNDVWRRHKNCDCIIDFIEDGKPQRVYNYREANTPEGRDAIERRKQVGVDIDTNDTQQLLMRKIVHMDTDIQGDRMLILANRNQMPTPYEQKVLEKVPPKDGFYDVAAHGNSSSIEYDYRNKEMNARELARIIRKDEKYHGEKIRLLACNAGETEDGFAQQLANALNVEVEAPNDVLIVFEKDGRMQVGIDGSGEMVLFKPGGNK